MKKTICLLSAALLIASVFSACGKTQSMGETLNPVEYNGETHPTTSAEHTVGKEESSTQINLGNKEYEINYTDSDGNAVRTEHYKNKKLVYYYEITASDENGNAVQQKYYDKNGKLFAITDNGYFYDENGSDMMEETFEYLLYNLTKDE